MRQEKEADNLNETLVCYESRWPNSRDLADNELGYLISKVARQEPHIDDLPVHPSVLAEGRGLASGGRLKKAIAIFRQALKLQPNIDLNPDTEEIDNDPEAVAKELAIEQEE